MRVLMLHNRYLQPGGEDSSFDAEVSILRENGCEVTPYEENNVRIQDLGRIGAAVRSIWSLETYEEIRRRLRNGRYDVVHVQNFFPLISPSAYYAARAERVAVIQSLHNYRLICPVGTFFRDGEICEDCVDKAIAWPGVMHSCYRNSAMATSAVAAMLSFNRVLGTWKNLVDVYVALTQFSRQKFIECGLPADKIMVKPNFVYSEVEPGHDRGAYAIFVGRLAPEKGVQTLLTAWERLENAVPLKVVGDGPMVTQVKLAAQGSHNIDYLGWLPMRDVLYLIRDADFLVLPSGCYEGFPKVIVEAFSVGTPVIGSRLGSISEIIEDGRTGWLFRPGDVGDLIAKIEWALTHPTECSSVGLQARLEYETKYTAERNFEQLMEIYQSAIARVQRLRPGSPKVFRNRA